VVFIVEAPLVPRPAPSPAYFAVAIPAALVNTFQQPSTLFAGRLLFLPLKAPLVPGRRRASRRRVD
jgi:hypothetical protein